jgi:imidazolonepropionase-like amidohydrolase
MATINGAKTLGLESKVGQIKEGFQADLCGVRLPDIPVGNIYSQLLDTASKNIFTMIAGTICYQAKSG